jgi:c-di-GMP-binding flagellar brake protein YcgR
MPISAEGIRRYPLSSVVSYEQGGRQLLTRTIDLGADGMKIETRGLLPDDEELTLRLILGEESIEAKGRVVRSELLPSNRTVSDIQFTELSEQNLSVLREFLATHRQLPKPMGMLSAGERRSQPRVGVSHPVLYVSDIRPRPKVGSTIDISLGGARIQTLQSLISGERLKISIAIRSQVIKCEGRVVYILWSCGENTKAGIRFEDLSGEDRDHLEEYIVDVLQQGG